MEVPAIGQPARVSSLGTGGEQIVICKVAIEPVILWIMVVYPYMFQRYGTPGRRCLPLDLKREQQDRAEEQQPYCLGG